MAKWLILILVAALAVGFFLFDWDHSKSVVPSSAESSSERRGLEPAMSLPSLQTPEDIGRNTELDSREQLTDSEREKIVLERERELIDLAVEYDEIRGDPNLVDEHKKVMAEKLRDYSEEVLPLALKKMEQADTQLEAEP